MCGLSVFCSGQGGGLSGGLCPSPKSRELIEVTIQVPKRTNITNSVGRFGSWRALERDCARDCAIRKASVLLGHGGQASSSAYSVGHK